MKNILLFAVSNKERYFKMYVCRSINPVTVQRKVNKFTLDATVFQERGDQGVKEMV